MHNYSGSIRPQLKTRRIIALSVWLFAGLAVSDAETHTRETPGATVLPSEVDVHNILAERVGTQEGDIAASLSA
jgi:hypothetical protein